MNNKLWITGCLIIALGVPSPVFARTEFEDLPRIGDAAADELSAQTEREIGEQVQQQLAARGELVENPELVDYLRNLGARLSASGPAAGRSFEFFAVREASLNAFALPGGYIGVHTGLIVASASESELASVLAHEIGHVTQRHIARMLARNRQSSVLSLAAMVLAVLAARSDPQAASGILALGESVAQDQMLSFSRDAEREADRVGLDILQQADFDSNAMVSFFGRLAQANRVYESGAPIYVRTHPLTTERMADIQNRIREQRYRQRENSLEFVLIKAELTALSDPSIDGLRRTSAALARVLRERSFVNEAATRFQAAVVALAQADTQGARESLQRVRQLLGTEHAILARFEVDIDRATGDLERALQRSSAAWKRYPDQRALVHQRAQLLLRAKHYQEAAGFLDAQVQRWRSDSQLWRMLSEARFGAGLSVQGRRAAAEHYVLEGGLLAAIEQLRLAQGEVGRDFYLGSQIDARLRELQARYTLQQAELDAR